MHLILLITFLVAAAVSFLHSAARQSVPFALLGAAMLLLAAHFR